jgi:hypothetical protein
MNAKEKEVKPQ